MNRLLHTLSLLWLPIAANAVLLVAVLGYGMDVRQLLVLYWVENFIVGAWHLARIAVASPPIWRSYRPVRSFWPRRLAYAAGFSLLYFAFNTGIGLLLAGIVTGDLQARQYGAEAMLRNLWADRAALTCLAVLTVSHGVTYVMRYLGEREYLTITPPELRNRPFPRLLVTFAVIFAGPLFLIADRPWLGALAFVGVKTGVELWFEWRERSKATVKG